MQAGTLATPSPHPSFSWAGFVKNIKVIGLIVFISLLSACSFTIKPTPTHVSAPTSISTDYPLSNRLLIDFDFLEYGISYDEIIKRVGKEDKDIGSGLYLLEYSLADGSKIILQFFTLESLNSAYLIYDDGKTESLVLSQK
jgi:hypothetical protein